MTYTPTTWADNSGGGTPITASQLNRMETGIVAANPTIVQMAITGSASNSSSSYTALYSSSSDIVINAVTGDVLQIGLSARVVNASTWLHLDVVTLLTSGGSAVNYISGAGSSGEGVQAWQTSDSYTAFTKVGGSIMYTVVSGDVSSGTVRLRVVGKSTGTRTFSSGSSNPVHFWAINYHQ